MKKKIFIVWLDIKFDSYREKWNKKKQFIEARRFSKFLGYVLAIDEEEAIHKAREYYDWQDEVIAFHVKVETAYECVLTDNRSGDFTVGEVAAVHFDTLKQNMASQDFLEYCKQELVGINEVIK